MMPRMTELVSWRGLMVVAVFAFGILQLVPWMRSSGREAAAQQSDCVDWDRAASEGIATLISDTSAAAELRLDEAILQLRRARKKLQVRRDRACAQRLRVAASGVSDLHWFDSHRQVEWAGSHPRHVSK